MAPRTEPAPEDDATFTAIERARVPRPSMRPEIRPPAAREDDDATLVYSSGMGAAPLVPAKRDGIRPRTASVFPPPPADRPRVFERPSREEKSARTVLRPSMRPETTELRPVSYSPPPPQFATPAPFPVERPSLRAVTIEAEPPLVAAVAPRVRAYPQERMAFAAVAALFAPIVLAFAFLGPGDAVAAQATLVTPPVLAAAVMTTVDARPAAPAALSAGAVAAVVAAPATPPAHAAIEPAHAPARVARPAAPRYYVQRPVILAPPGPRPAVAKASPAAKSGLPDAEAASALARAQLEASLR
jgi:hypothetical protein